VTVAVVAVETPSLKVTQLIGNEEYSTFEEYSIL